MVPASMMEASNFSRELALLKLGTKKESGGKKAALKS